MDDTTPTPSGQPAGTIVSRDTITRLPIDAIKVNPHQPRKDFGALEGLAASIKLHGVQQPITVADDGDGTYTLIAGERWLRAAQLAGEKMIPAIVRIGDPAILALVENIQREDLRPLEEAAALGDLIDRGETQQGLADKLGVTRDCVAQKVRLSRLPSEGEYALRSRIISESAARQILRLAIFDHIATTDAEEHRGCGNWANYWAHFALWRPWYARSTADLQFAVDEFMSDLFFCADDYEDLPAADAEQHAGKLDDAHSKRCLEAKCFVPRTISERAGQMYLLLRPDWSKLTAVKREEIWNSHARWLREFCRRHPETEVTG